MNIAPDTNQPWVYEPSIVDRNLCTPTAFSSQFRAFFSVGMIQEIPNTVLYIPPIPFNQRGWKDFVFDGPAITNVQNWGSVPPTINPSFSWWFNTNNKGAINIPNTVGFGTTILGAILTPSTDPLTQLLLSLAILLLYFSGLGILFLIKK